MGKTDDISLFLFRSSVPLI